MLAQRTDGVDNLHPNFLFQSLIDHAKDKTNAYNGFYAKGIIMGFFDKVKEKFQSVKESAKEMAQDIGEDASGIARGIQSNVRYQELQHALYTPVGATLQQQKIFALKACNDYIQYLTNHNAVDLFIKLNSEPSLKYIREENGFYRLFGVYGHTSTYKKILGLLKARVNENYQRHTDSSTRLLGDHFAEDKEIKELIMSRRGRMPNLLAMIGIDVGETGKYMREYEDRYKSR